MATALPIIGLVVSAVGTVFSAISQSNAASFNAKIAQQNAMLARNQAAAAALAQQKKAKLIIGQEAANYGASGITMEGSPIDVLEESARNAELDRQKIIDSGNIEAAGYQDQAALDESKASSAIIGGIVGAGGSFASGIGRLLPGTSIALPGNGPNNAGNFT